VPNVVSVTGLYSGRGTFFIHAERCVGELVDVNDDLVALAAVKAPASSRSVGRRACQWRYKDCCRGDSAAAVSGTNTTVVLLTFSQANRVDCFENGTGIDFKAVPNAGP
jgi:hypothetical protein